MNRTIEVSLTHAEGAIVRTLGLIERRGFIVRAVETAARTTNSPCATTPLRPASPSA